MSGYGDGAAGDGPERTFEALPPARGRGFAVTWWGQAWLRALEGSALDGEQLKRGRRCARGGAVGAVSVRPGRLTAVVADPDGTRHRTDVLLQRFGPAEWDRFLGLAAAESGHIAALLDREMPPELAQDAAAAGVELLPGTGDLDPRCACGEWDHCAHTAALCYQLARLLDRDPFLLLLLRGLGEHEVLDALRERSASVVAGAHGAARRAPGVDAAEAFAAWQILPPLPEPPRVPAGPVQPALLDVEAEPGEGLDPGAVEFLAEAAAGEARRLLAAAVAPGHEAQELRPERSFADDLVRLAAAAEDVRVLARLAAAGGRDRPGLARAVRAWRYGGPAAVSVLEEAWQPDGEPAARARAALAAAWADEPGGPPALECAGNRWTAPDGSAQLRLDRAGHWWPYRQEGGHWEPAGAAETDPASAWAVLGDA
ncbi:SWF or SNF family helicase [Streptomyces bambusae]|uniref:SWIM zinc finger family protein n=1 Tax=Streptomyces bambusae TaxID=1550616 RepID=UPI001CFD1316|nr:SWF or SNF family helicase [Streptomyces bambusae]MCB5168389.1 SWF or SNF family helicase [Streptomyces bambusae]